MLGERHEGGRLAAIEEMQRLCVVVPEQKEAALHPDDRGKAALAAAMAIAHELRTGRRGAKLKGG